MLEHVLKAEDQAEQVKWEKQSGNPLHLVDPGWVGVA